MNTLDLASELKGNSYPGRGIVCGRSLDGKYAVCAYFIMGRSSNSRNRIFVKEGDGIRTQAFDESKLEDPSLIIYAPVRVLGKTTIVTNGDQTDTIYDGMDKGLTFEQALRSREFEPDGPNFTPRISAVLKFSDSGAGDADADDIAGAADVTGREPGYSFEMSILKSAEGRDGACHRYTFSYDSVFAGEGRFIHTYMGDGSPLPSFVGEPKKVNISGDIDEFTDMLWESLNDENKVSLFVRYIDAATGKECETRIVNKKEQ